MREHLSYMCKNVSDHEHRELKVSDVLEIFKNNYFDCESPVAIKNMSFTQKADGVDAYVTFEVKGEATTLHTTGNGSLNAVNNALKKLTGSSYKLEVYSEHSMQGQGSGSLAAAYIGLEDEKGNISWGAGTNTDIIKASINALLAAYNNMTK